MIGKGNKTLSPAYCRLLSSLLSKIQCPRLERSAEKKLYGLIVSIGLEAFVDLFIEIFSIGNLVSISIFVQYFRTQGGDNFFGTHGIPSRAQILDLYIKECIMTKSVKSEWYLNKTSRNIFRIMTEDDCKILIPSIQKGLLRSPEIAAEVKFLSPT